MRDLKRLESKLKAAGRLADRAVEKAKERLTLAFPNETEAERILRVVKMRSAKDPRLAGAARRTETDRTLPLQMSVLAYCHGQKHFPTPSEAIQMVADVKRSLAGNDPNASIQFPQGVSGALLRVGGEESRIFVVVLRKAESDDEKRALAHELAHLRSQLLQDVDPPGESPKSAF